MNPTPSCITFYCSCSVVTWKTAQVSRLTSEASQAPRSVFVIELLHYLLSLDILQVDIELWVKATADRNNRLVKRQLAFCPHTSNDSDICGQALLPSTAFVFHPGAFIGWMMMSVWFFFCFLFLLFFFLLVCFCTASRSDSSLLTGLSVCSSAPVSMKIQPLNQTALTVSWERPLTIYHPPITSYMVSYSWVKSDIADEKTFTKTGDQRTVSTINCLKQPPKPESFLFYFFGRGLNSPDFFFLLNLRCIWQDQRVTGSVTVCRGGDRLRWTLLVAVEWYEAPDTPLSLSCLRIDTHCVCARYCLLTDAFIMACTRYILACNQ